MNTVGLDRGAHQHHGEGSAGAETGPTVAAESTSPKARPEDAESSAHPESASSSSRHKGSDSTLLMDPGTSVGSASAIACAAEEGLRIPVAALTSPGPGPCIDTAGTSARATEEGWDIAPELLSPPRSPPAPDTTVGSEGELHFSVGVEDGPGGSGHLERSRQSALPEEACPSQTESPGGARFGDISADIIRELVRVPRGSAWPSASHQEGAGPRTLPTVRRPQAKQGNLVLYIVLHRELLEAEQGILTNDALDRHGLRREGLLTVCLAANILEGVDVRCSITRILGGLRTLPPALICAEAVLSSSPKSSELWVEAFLEYVQGHPQQEIDHQTMCFIGESILKNKNARSYLWEIVKAANAVPFFKEALKELQGEQRAILANLMAV